MNDNDNDKPRRVALPPEAIALLEEQRRRFVAKFGREPGPNDPMFFDSDAEGPDPVAITPDAFTRNMTGAMLAVDAPLSVVYAFRKTGIPPMTDAEWETSAYSADDLAEWAAAQTEFEKMSRQQKRLWRRKLETECAAEIAAAKARAAKKEKR